MQAKHITEAKAAAKAFLEKVTAYEKRLKADESFARYCEITGYKETGALRRSSLDLTRALAKMRNGK